MNIFMNISNMFFPIYYKMWENSVYFGKLQNFKEI